MYFDIGYVEIDDSVKSVDDAYKKAKIALEKAKRINKNITVKYNFADEIGAFEEDNFKQLINAALNNKDFTVVYQEKVDSHSQKVIGVEALVRWESSELGFVSPAVFIPIIEKSSRFADFGNIIVEKIVNDFPELQKKYGKDIKVSMNISPPYLLSQDFSEVLETLIRSETIKPENIVFEITEESFIENLESVIDTLSLIKKYGYLVSLDDFGSGYSSLRYLATLSLMKLNR